MYIFLIDQKKDEIVFTYNLVKGIAKFSHGIYIAKIAGIDKNVIENSVRFLKRYDEQLYLGNVKHLIKNN